MSDRLEVALGLIVSEDDFAQAAAIEFAVILAQRRAKAFEDFRQRGLPGRNYAARRDVGIYHGDSEAFELAGEFAFARGDAAGDGDHEPGHAQLAGEDQRR